MSDPSNEKQPGLLELLEQWEKQGASDADKTLRMKRYLDSRARDKGVPLHGSFELTPLCNLDCKMCYVHLSEKQLHKSGKQLLTVEQWKHIMDQAIAEGMISATLTGGEAMLYPGFNELYLYLLEQGIEVTVKTNGLLLTEDRVTFFCQHPPAGIQVSLYGGDENTYARVTGVLGFATAMAGVKRIHAAGIETEIVVTPSKPMLNGIDTLLNTLNTLGIHYGINAGLFSPREETGRTGEHMELSLDEYIQIYKIQACISGRSVAPNCSKSIPLPPSSNRPAFGLRCAAGRSNFAVHWDGVMHPCISFNQIGIDLLHQSFHKAWGLMHQKVLEYSVPSECTECKLKKCCPACVLQHEYGGKAGHANPAICTRAKRLIEEGLIHYQ